MSNTFTEVTNQSWFGRIKNAVGGIIIGVILFMVAVPLLFWNEGRAVKRYKTLKEGSGVVQTVQIDTVDPANSGKLVHLTGHTECDEILEDPTFGISIEAIRLKRHVEMYQWKEKTSTKTKKKVGGGTKKTKTYSYEKVWSSSVINSSDFKEKSDHQNPGSMAYQSMEISADDVTLGAFKLSQSLISKIKNWQSVSLDMNHEIPASLGSEAKRQNDGFYLGKNPDSPEIGDLKVTFKAAYPAEVSVIASQVGETFEPYQTEAGGTIELLQIGVHSADAMIQKAQESNKILTWVLRLVGFLMMLIGMRAILGVLSVLADLIPFLGNIVGFGTTLIAFFIAAIVSSGVIGVAWVTYRPLIGIPILLVGVTLVVLLIMKLAGANKKSA